MGENGSLSASDVALLSGNGNGFGGWGESSFLWIFALLILAGGGFGGLGWGNNGLNAIGYENLATSNEVQRGFDNQNLQAQTRDILAAVNAGTAQSVAATTQNYHDTLAAMQNFYNETATDMSDLRVGQGNILANVNECCGSTKQLIQQLNYEEAMRDAATNANFTNQIQSVKDMIAQNKIEGLQSQVNQLQIAQATNGMLRFPDSWSYGAGAFPPIFGGCNCNNNI